MTTRGHNLLSISTTLCRDLPDQEIQYFHEGACLLMGSRYNSTVLCTDINNAGAQNSHLCRGVSVFHRYICVSKNALVQTHKLGTPICGSMRVYISCTVKQVYEISILPLQHNVINNVGESLREETKLRMLQCHR